ncbi:MAG: hypothetical protein QXD84_09650 [Thermoplasmata archaeon]
MGDSRGQVRRITGDFFIHIGAGGALLSFFWDVVYRGRPLDTSAIGPLKLAGIGAGLVIMVAGLWLRFGSAEATPRLAAALSGRPRRVAPLPEAVPEAEGAAGERVIGTGDAAGAAALEPARAAEEGVAPAEIADSIPVAEAIPVEEGAGDSIEAAALPANGPSGAPRRPDPRAGF